MSRFCLGLQVVAPLKQKYKVTLKETLEMIEP